MQDKFTKKPDSIMDSFCNWYEIIISYGLQRESILESDFLNYSFYIFYRES